MNTTKKSVVIEVSGKAEIGDNSFIRGDKKTVDLETVISNNLTEFDKKNVKLKITIEVEATE